MILASAVRSIRVVPALSRVALDVTSHALSNPVRSTVFGSVRRRSSGEPLILGYDGLWSTFTRRIDHQ